MVQHTIDIARKKGTTDRYVHWSRLPLEICSPKFQIWQVCPPNLPKSGLSALSLLADGEPEHWLGALSRAAAEPKPQTGLINALTAVTPATLAESLSGLSLLNSAEPENQLGFLSQAVAESKLRPGLINALMAASPPTNSLGHYLC